MAYALIPCRSVTYAQRAVKMLQEAGYRASMRRLPADLPETGCGHAVRVERERAEDALSLMNKAGFQSHKIFCENEDGSVVACP